MNTAETKREIVEISGDTGRDRREEMCRYWETGQRARVEDT